MKRRADAKARLSSPSAFVLLLLVASGCAGCGGGMPLFHPARALPLGEVRAVTGFSANVAVAGFGDALRDATNDAASNRANALSPPDATFARGALVAASVAPGLAPVVAARVGLGDASEGGLSYTGRSVRGDVRHSFDLAPAWALSIGVGASAALTGRQESDGALPNVALENLHGWGADAPLLIGYQSEGELYLVWAGARASWEHAAIDGPASEPSGATVNRPVSLSATSVAAGGLLGLAVGFRHVHVAMEVDASYQTIQGELSHIHAQISGLTVAPSSALWWRF